LKIDFSTIILVIIAVIPGLFAIRSRNLVAPRSFAPQGTSAELAELVALGFTTHGILILLVAAFLLVFGWQNHGDLLFFFRKIDAAHIDSWSFQHISEATLLITIYVFISFVLSHLLGFVYGVWRLQSSIAAKLFGKAAWLRRFGITGLLGERPIIYEVLNPAVDHNVANSMFVEVEMRDGLGLYSGQLEQFAIVQDEEPHKPIYLIDVWYRKDRSMEYERVETDGLMIDLADVLTLSVRQVDVSSTDSESGSAVEETTGTDRRPTQQEIAARANTYWQARGCQNGHADEDWLRAELDLRNS
jgi:hypothetical protein